MAVVRRAQLSAPGRLARRGGARRAGRNAARRACVAAAAPAPAAAPSLGPPVPEAGVAAVMPAVEPIPFRPPPPPPPRASSGTSPFVWILCGMGIVVGGQALMGGFKNVQQNAQQAMINQMLKSMQSQAGAPGAGFPGMPPMGGTPGAGGMPGMPGMPPMPPMPPPTPPPPAATPPPPAAAPASSPSTPAEPAKAGEPVTAEFTSATDASKDKKEKEAAAGAASSASFFQDAEVVDAGMADAGAAGGQQNGFFTVEMLETMLEDPNMQQMIYPHLPETMRNPETFKWMLEQPVYRQQLQEMLNQMNTGDLGNMDPNVANMMKDFDINSPQVKEQFDQLGMKPEDVIGKIMADPEMATAFQNPKIQQAIIECSSNPMAITKYQNDPEIMNVFTKISGMFPPGAGGMPMPPGGVPGGMPAGPPGGGYPPPQ